MGIKKSLQGSGDSHNKDMSNLNSAIIARKGTTMKDMIERKNNILRNGAEQFRNVGKLAVMCRGVRFTTLEAADEFMTTLANTLTKLSFTRFDLLEEADISLPEAEEGTLDDDLPVSEEVEA